MDHKTDRAQFFKDVAAMTGLLYPFCNCVRSEVRKAGGNERIEVRKIIERSGDPYQVDYTVAGNTRSEMATLYRSADMHCIPSPTRQSAMIGFNNQNPDRGIGYPSLWL